MTTNGYDVGMKFIMEMGLTLSTTFYLGFVIFGLNPTEPN